MSKLKVVALFLGIAAVPVVSLARAAADAAWSAMLPVPTGLLMVAVIAAPLSVFGVVVVRYWPDRARISVAALGWATLAFFHVGPVRKGIEATGWVQPWQWAIVGVTTIAIGVWIGIRFDPSARFLVTFVPLLLIVELFQLGLDAPRWAEPAPAEITSREANLGSPPSIWLIVLDSHASPAVLRDLYDVDLAAPVEQLESKGFTVWDDARSSYSHTLASIPSLLSGETWDPEAVERLHPELLAGVHGDTWLMASLKQAGHSFRMVPTNWSRSECGTLVDHCFPTSGYDEHWYFLMLETPLPNIFPRLLPHPWPTGGIRTLELISTISSAYEHVTFVHSLASHPPPVIDAECNPVPAAVDALEGQLLCTHVVLQDALASIDLTTDIVIITSDHGYDLGDTSAAASTWTDSVARARFSAFAAISTPDNCESSFPERLSAPQILPLVLNCYGAELGIPAHRFVQVIQQPGGSIEASELNWDGWSVYAP
jgi:hypothetical protein